MIEIKFKGSYYDIGFNNGLEILNINDPENPFEVAQFFDGGELME